MCISDKRKKEMSQKISKIVSIEFVRHIFVIMIVVFVPKIFAQKIFFEKIFIFFVLYS